MRLFYTFWHRRINIVGKTIKFICTRCETGQKSLLNARFSTYFKNSYRNKLYIENDNVHIHFVLCICWHCFQYYPTKLFSDKPETPTITFNKYPFVGDEIEFTCASQLQHWPVGLSSSLTYTFFIDGAQQYNTLSITINISDKGKKVSCNAMDDRRDVSNVSNVIVLDPYCKYS